MNESNKPDILGTINRTRSEEEAVLLMLFRQLDPRMKERELARLDGMVMILADVRERYGIGAYERKGA